MQPEMRGAPAPVRHQPPAAPTGKKRRFGFNKFSAELRVTILWGCALILAAIAIWAYASPIHAENSLVNTNEYQAVFLTNGQVYFGKVSAINKDYIVLTKVFYLQTNSSSNNPQSGKNNSNLTLVKLGVSELHAPEDKMVINQPQVSFWENIKDSSKVVKAINQYNANPNASSSSTTTGQ